MKFKKRDIEQEIKDLKERVARLEEIRRIENTPRTMKTCEDLKKLRIWNRIPG